MRIQYIFIVDFIRPIQFKFDGYSHFFRFAKSIPLTLNQNSKLKTIQFCGGVDSGAQHLITLQLRPVSRESAVLSSCAPCVCSLFFRSLSFVDSVYVYLVLCF